MAGYHYEIYGLVSVSPSINVQNGSSINHPCPPILLIISYLITLIVPNRIWTKHPAQYNGFEPSKACTAAERPDVANIFHILKLEWLAARGILEAYRPAVPLHIMGSSSRRPFYHPISSWVWLLFKQPPPKPEYIKAHSLSEPRAYGEQSVHVRH